MLLLVLAAGRRTKCVGHSNRMMSYISRDVPFDVVCLLGAPSQSDARPCESARGLLNLLFLTAAFFLEAASYSIGLSADRPSAHARMRCCLRQSTPCLDGIVYFHFARWAVASRLARILAVS